VAQSEHSFGAPETRRQGLARRFRDHSRARKIEKRSGFRDAHIGERREAGEHTPSARIREDRDERRRRLVEEIHGAGRLRHLHQAEDALLHACAARAAHGHDRQTRGGRKLGTTPEALTDHAAHAAAHEAEVQKDKHAANALHHRGPGHYGIRQAGLRLGGAQTLRVRLQIDEPQRIDRGDRRPQLAERAFVGKLPDTLARADAQMEPAERADHESGADFGEGRTLATRWAFPLRLGRLADATLDLDDDVH
jgi:hypothetical protein